MASSRAASPVRGGLCVRLSGRFQCLFRAWSRGNMHSAEPSNGLFLYIYHFLEEFLLWYVIKSDLVTMKKNLTQNKVKTDTVFSKTPSTPCHQYKSPLPALRPCVMPKVKGMACSTESCGVLWFIPQLAQDPSWRLHFQPRLLKPCGANTPL